MKNPRLRNALLVLLITASAAAYIFINTVSQDGSHKKCTATEEVEQVEKGMLIPEVQIVKMILEKGRQLLPAS